MHGLMYLGEIWQKIRSSLIIDNNCNFQQSKTSKICDHVKEMYTFEEKKLMTFKIFSKMSLRNLNKNIGDIGELFKIIIENVHF